MWAYAVWKFDRDDWYRLDDGAIWTTGSLQEAASKSKALRRSTVLSFYAEASS